MPNDDFKPGDVVCLRSGGPAMTVASKEGSSFACLWFDDEELRSAKFPAVTLDPVDLDSEADESDEEEDEEDEDDDDDDDDEDEDEDEDEER